MNYFNKILNGNIPANIFDLIKNNKLDYKLNQEYPYLQINTNDTNNNAANLLHVALIKKSMKLNYNNIVSSLNTILINSFKIAIENNKNEIAKLRVSTDDTQINVIINLVVKVFSNEFIKIISKLPLTHHFKDLHIKLIDLSGLTGLSLNTINTIAEKISLDYELSKILKIKTSINIQQLFYNILTAQSKTCSDISLKCLFTDEYINQLALTIINTWEFILDSIIKLIKYDKIVSFYAFSIDFVDQLHQTTQLSSIEKFGGLDIATTTNVTDRTRADTLKETNQNMNKSQVISGMAKLVSTAMTSAVSKNSADLLRTIAIVNKQSYENLKGETIKITGIKQTSTIKQETNMNVTQEITNKVVKDITKNISDTIDTTIKDNISNIKKSSDTGKGGTVVGDVIKDLGGKAMDMISDVLSASVGSSTNTLTEKEISDKLKNTFNLDQSFKYNKNNEAADAITETLNPENLAKCVAETSATNELAFKGLTATGGALEISNIQQENIVSDVMNCAFNQKTLNDISTKIVAEFDSTIQQLLDNINTNLDEETKARIEGDIYAIGTAGSALIGGVADVVENTGDAIREGGKGVAMATAGTALLILSGFIGVGLVLYIAYIAYTVMKASEPYYPSPPEPDAFINTDNAVLPTDPSAPEPPADAFINTDTNVLEIPD